MAGETAALADQTVLVSGGSIVGLGHRDVVPVPETFNAIDGTGKYLMPGLADMHVHLEYNDDPRVLDLFLVNGVTTVRNMDGRPYILEWRDRIARGEWRGPTIHTAGPILDGDPPLRDDNLAIGLPDDARRAVRICQLRLTQRSLRRPRTTGCRWPVTCHVALTSRSSSFPASARSSTLRRWAI